MRPDRFLLAFLPLAMVPASCSAAPTGENPQTAANQSANASQQPFEIEEIGTFEEPWAMAFAPGTGTLFVTERKGAIKFRNPDGTIGTVSGVPKVDYGGQGGLGDFIFAPAPPSTTLDKRVVYLSWAEAGQGDTRGAAVGRADLVCESATACNLNNLQVIWRQAPKTTGRGHYSHRLAFSPDGKYLYVASGDRQKMEPAQDLSVTLGKIVRLLPDGTPAPDNPFAERGSPSDEIWSYGHRNILGLRFDSQGRLWDLEHGPAGGDELNLVEKGANYGWPVVSDGNHYDGRPIPHHSTRPEFDAPAIGWTPVIAPGDMIFYSGSLFADWQGDILIAAMKPAAIVRVKLTADVGKEMARFPMENRIRSIAQAPDGAVWAIEDGRNLSKSRLLRLTPASD